MSNTPKTLIPVSCAAVASIRRLRFTQPMCVAYVTKTFTLPNIHESKPESSHLIFSDELSVSSPRNAPFSLKGLKFTFSSIEDSMTLADLKMRAFRRDGDSVNDELNVRFSLFRAVNERRKKGAQCLMACLYGPFDIEVLPFICASPELSTSKDSEMMRTFLSSSQDNNAIRSAIQLWRSSSTNRRIVIGCVDCSTHEFQLSPQWKSTDRELYISDMAIHPAFQGLGLGRALLRSLVSYAESERIQDLYLHVEEHNARAAGLYASEGFAPAAETPATAALYEAMSFDRDCKNTLMQRPVLLR